MRQDRLARHGRAMSLKKASIPDIVDTDTLLKVSIGNLTLKVDKRIAMKHYVTQSDFLLHATNI